MNVIYLNENLKYCEAYPNESGIVVIPERNLIVGFVSAGMVYALKDTESKILTAFETFVQFNDMSINMVEEHHFSGENRSFDISGNIFCETKEFFSCIPYKNENVIFDEFVTQFERGEMTDQLSHYIMQTVGVFDPALNDWTGNFRFEFTITYPGKVDKAFEFFPDPGKKILCLIGMPTLETARVTDIFFKIPYNAIFVGKGISWIDPELYWEGSYWLNTQFFDVSENRKNIDFKNFDLDHPLSKHVAGRGGIKTNNVPAMKYLQNLGVQFIDHAELVAGMVDV